MVTMKRTPSTYTFTLEAKLLQENKQLFNTHMTSMHRGYREIRR